MGLLWLCRVVNDYQSPLSWPLADEPDEQVNVVHAEDHDEYHLGHYDDHGYDGQGGKYANRCTLTNSIPGKLWIMMMGINVYASLLNHGYDKDGEFADV